MADAQMAAFRDELTETTILVRDDRLPGALGEDARSNLASLDRLVDLAVPVIHHLEPGIARTQNAMRKVRIAAQAYAERPAGNQAMAAELEGGVEELGSAIGVLARQTYEHAHADNAPDEYLRQVSRFREAWEARRLAGEVRDVRDAAVQVLEETRKAAGTTGSTAMADHFRRLR